MVREDLISSAVSFLQDPSVVASPLDKRIAFLQSKNLTQEEIDISLARAGDVAQSSSPTATPPPPIPQSGYQTQQTLRQFGGYGYGYGPYPGAPWTQEPPRRDWRDWFIMATVTTSVGYGLYTLANRYILPLISPPTPPQLSADKASIDASFSRAFALIDQLASDTATLKETEAQRTEKLDTTLKDVDAVTEDLKAANRRQEAESRIIAEQIGGLKEQVPKALEGWKAGGDARLEELSGEMQSLRKLLENRVGRSGGGGGASTPVNRGNPQSQNDSHAKDTPSSSQIPQNATSSTLSNSDTASSASAPGITSPKTNESPPRDRKAIPAWQRAAASEKSGKAASSSSPGGSNAENNGSNSTKTAEAGA